PNVENWPNPASSIRMRTMLGAFLGDCTGCGNCAGSESLYVRPTLPGKWKSGRGKTVGVREVGSGLGFSWPNMKYTSPAMASSVTAIDVRAVRIGRLPFYVSLTARLANG